jgi:hypothetical protein
MALMSAAPEGIPLKIDSTMKMTAMPQMANRPPIVTHMTVSKVTEKELAADTFEAPKDYTKQQSPMMGMGHGPMMVGPGMGGHASMGGPNMMKPIVPGKASGPAIESNPAAAPTKVPE